MSNADAPSLRDTDAPPRPTSRQIAAACAASMFGWGLDLFDLFILLYVAPVVGRLFFPADTPMLSLAGAYASFGVTLLVRPYGSALFGSYADQFGRRRALTIAVIGVGMSTAVFGLLPSVAQIGWSATAIFLLFRVVQGVFVGGVVAASHTIGTETVPERWRGLMSGAVGGGGSAMGGLLASLVFFIVSLIAPGPAFAEWGWRLMFFSGLLTSLVGYLLLHNLVESPIFTRLRRQKTRIKGPDPTGSPVKALLSSAHRKNVVVAIMLSFGGGAAYYLTSGYLPTFLKVVDGIPNASASIMLVAANVSAGLGACAFGELSQHLGRRTVFLIMGAVRLVAFPCLFLAMKVTTDPTLLSAYVMLLAFIANASYGPLLIYLNESFPTALRATGTGLSWNVGFALGGILPTLVSLTARAPSHIPAVLSAFTVGVTLVYLAGAFLTPETRGNLERL